MIEIHDGLGGWTIKVTNGNQVMRFECAQYIVKCGGVNWFDFDHAMHDAEQLDRKQQKQEIEAQR